MLFRVWVTDIPLHFISLSFASLRRFPQRPEDTFFVPDDYSNVLSALGNGSQSHKAAVETMLTSATRNYV